MTNNPNGRPKGIVNKVTTKRRELINMILDEELPRFKRVLGELRKEDKKLYARMIIDLIEFGVPKLMRSEVVNEVSAPVDVTGYSLDQLMKLRAGNGAKNEVQLP